MTFAEAMKKIMDKPQILGAYRPNKPGIFTYAHVMDRANGHKFEPLYRLTYLNEFNHERPGLDHLDMYDCHIATDWVICGQTD